MVEEAAWRTIDFLYEREGDTLAVYYFTLPDKSNDGELSEYLRDGLTTQIANAASEDDLDIKVINRQQLDQIMAEQSFQLSDLVDQDTQVRIGRLIGADLILAGTLSPVDEETWHLNAQIVEVETGVVLGGFVYDFWVETD